MTSWDRERWRKLYLREPKDQEILPWQTRGLRDLCIRIAEDDGRLGRDVNALQRLLRAGDELSEHVRELLADGFLEQRDDGLYVRNLPHAQSSPDPSRPPKSSTPARAPTGGRWANTSAEERSAAARKASDARWGRRIDGSGDASPDASVTDATTDGDASVDASESRAVSGSSDPSESLPEEREEENRSDQPDQSDASSHDALTHQRRMTDDASSDGGGGGKERLRLDYVTECPPNLVELCRACGLLRTLAKQHRAPETDVEQAIGDYRDHFTKGRGHGEKRAKWGNQVRGRINDLARANRLLGIAAAALPSTIITPEDKARRDARLKAQEEAMRRKRLELAAELSGPAAASVKQLVARIGGAE